MPKTKDNVNHPMHYENSTCLECIEAMQIVLGIDAFINYCKGAAFKYVWRYKNKGGKEDLQKALWYLDYAEKVRGNKGLESEYEQIYIMRDIIKHKLKEVV